MIFFRKALCAATAGTMLLSLSGCGAATKLDDVASLFQNQQSLQCSLSYSVTMQADPADADSREVTQIFSADAQVNLSEGSSYLSGTLDTKSDGVVVSSSEVESYTVGSESSSYNRYDNYYYADAAENSLLTIINAPRILSLDSDLYQKADATEILYGSTCDVYRGTELADGSGQAFFSYFAQQDVSLEGCSVDTTLRVYQDTGLPADLALDYTGLDQLDLSVTDALGNHYTITALSYEVVYRNYGAQVSVAVPDEFREAALSGDTASVPDALDGIADTPDADADADTESTPADATYSIYNDDGSYYYQIGVPEYMQLDEADEDSVSFYYLYDDQDIEYIEYTLYNDYTSTDETNYALSLPTLFEDSDGVSNISSSGIQSLTVGDYLVQYNILYMTLVDDGVTYDVMDIYSWVSATDADEDCLEVSVTEYNATGDGLFVDPETELQYAYEAILGYRAAT